MIKVDKEKATECDEVCWNSLGWCEMGRHFSSRLFSTDLIERVRYVQRLDGGDGVSEVADLKCSLTQQRHAHRTYLLHQRGWGGQGRLPGLKVTLPWYLGFPSAPLESQGHQDLLTSWYSGYKAFTRVSVSWTYFLEGRASPSVSVWLGGTTWDR